MLKCSHVCFPRTVLLNFLGDYCPLQFVSRVCMVVNGEGRVSLGCVKLGTRKTPRHCCPNGPGLICPHCSHGQSYFFPRHYRHMRKYFAVSELTRNPNQYPYKGNDWQVSFSGNKWSWNLGRFSPKIIAKKSYGPIRINTNKKQYTLNI